MTSEILKFLFIAILIALILGMGVAHCRECLRVHPWWYCSQQR